MDAYRTTPRGGRLPATLTPARVPGLVLWLDASRADSLTVDGSNRVSAWADLSGQGNDVIQAVEANMPTLAAAAINSRNAIEFADVSSQYLELTPWSALTAAPVECLVACAVDRVTSGNRTVLSVSDPTSPSDYWFMTTNAADLRFDSRGGAIGRAEKSGLTVDDPAVWGYREASSSSRYARLNGVDGTENTSTITPAGLDTLGVGRLARNNTSEAYFDGKICEILLFSRALTGAQRSALESYLALKWGVTLA